MDKPGSQDRSATKSLIVSALLLLVAIGVLTPMIQGLLAPTQVSRLDGPPPAYRAQGPRVTLFATSWCGYCAKAREFFNDNGIAYLDLDIERNAEAEAEHETLGGRGVPVIVIDNRVLYGWSESETAQQLQLAGLLP